MRCQIHIRAIGQLERSARRRGVKGVSEGKRFLLCWSIAKLLTIGIELPSFSFNVGISGWLVMVAIECLFQSTV